VLMFHRPTRTACRSVCRKQPEHQRLG